LSNSHDNTLGCKGICYAKDAQVANATIEEMALSFDNSNGGKQTVLFSGPTYEFIPPLSNEGIGDEGTGWENSYSALQNLFDLWNQNSNSLSEFERTNKRVEIRINSEAGTE